jgi:hypothetical protein
MSKKIGEGLRLTRRLWARSPRTEPEDQTVNQSGRRNTTEGDTNPLVCEEIGPKSVTLPVFGVERGPSDRCGLGFCSGENPRERPFRFQRGPKVLPARDLEVERLNVSAMVVRNMGAKQAALALAMATVPKGPQGTSISLVFNRYGQCNFRFRI